MFNVETSENGLIGTGHGDKTMKCSIVLWQNIYFSPLQQESLGSRFRSRHT